jgi:O-antigen biosynthesis protein WbqP
MVKLTSKGPALYWSDRVGINNSIFRMPKFRTMRVDTPAVATHLMNQDDLIELRTGKGIHKLIPGITGWAQVNGRDELPIPVKAEFDEYYLKNRSFLFDLKILWMTVVKVVRREGITH